MPQKDEPANSGFWAFWSSLPGILTGVPPSSPLSELSLRCSSAVTAAHRRHPAPRSQRSRPPRRGPAMEASASGSGDDACFGQYFKGIPGDRVGTVEAGAQAYDVITESQTKMGTIGMTFTSNGRPIGAIRFAFFPENRLFKIESIVDARCRAIEDYESRTGGDKHVWEDSSAVRLRLDGRFYDLTANGAGSVIRIAFVPVVP